MLSALVLFLAALAATTPLNVARQSTQTWMYHGCYQDSQSKRTLAFRAPTDKDNVQTIDTCTTYCGSHGYSWAGLEYGSECWCDQRLFNATKSPDSDCSMECVGNSSQTCGNGDRLSVYNNGISDSGPITNPGPPGWTYLACYTDSSSRTLRNALAVSGSGMTVAGCAAVCKSNGYTLAGVEYGQECWCDRTIRSPGATTTSGCNMPCAGNSSEYCGGLDRLNVYESADAVAENPSTTLAGWQSLGCYTDDPAARTLQLVEQVPGGGPNMTVNGCLSACGQAGYSYSGLEFAEECWCGNALRNPGVCALDQSSCYQTCRGDPTQICGGPDRLNVYYSGANTSIASCEADAVSSSTSRTTSTVTASTSSISSSVAPSGISSTTSSILSVATETKTSSTISETPSSVSSATTSAPSTSLSSSMMSPSSSSQLPSTTTTTTSATPTSTGCPAFWSDVVRDLAPLMRVNGECTNTARVAIRFAFHDSTSFSTKLPFYAPAAGGADGSLLLSSTEINRPDNNGLHDYHSQLNQKLTEYKAVGYDLTAADLIQVAGSLGVLACPGGRVGRVLVGRTDTDVAAPDGLMPHAFGSGSDHNTLLQLFVDKGFTARDLAALVGAHSTSITNFEADNGIPPGTPQDTTPGQWDVAYYNETYFPKPGMARFDSDINLSLNETTRGVGRQFRSFVGNQGAWGASFASAWQALTLLGVPNSVRANMRDCSVVVGTAFA